MDLMVNFIKELYILLLKEDNNYCLSTNVIRKHTRKLSKVGELSFPLKIQCWNLLLSDRPNTEDKDYTILDHRFGKKSIDSQLEELKDITQSWNIPISKIEVQNNDVHIFLNRNIVIKKCISQVISEKDQYGAIEKLFTNRISVELEDEIVENVLNRMNLSELRAVVAKRALSNILDYLTRNFDQIQKIVQITLKSNMKDEYVLVCGSVIDQSGMKDYGTGAEEYYERRAKDVNLLAQHRFGLRLDDDMKGILDDIAKGSVIMELLENKLHKNIKILMDNPLNSNKGPAFIFYNCARISKLLETFHEKRNQGLYGDFPSVDKLDFTSLLKEEEWEILYVYILQFPSVVRSSVGDIAKGILNLHHLIAFLGNLSMAFSSYYRSVPILQCTKSRKDIVLYERIYFLTAIQYVYNTALVLLDAKPIKKM